jgi:hypothetical protein
MGVSFRDAHLLYGVRTTLLTRMAIGSTPAHSSRNEMGDFLVKIGLTLDDVDQPWPDREVPCAGD